MKDDYRHLVESLKTERDELNVRMHLASSELRDEWLHLEERWDKIQFKLEKAASAASDSAEDVGAAIHILGDELKAGYRKIREAMH